MSLFVLFFFSFFINNFFFCEFSFPAHLLKLFFLILICTFHETDSSGFIFIPWMCFKGFHTRTVFGFWLLWLTFLHVHSVMAYVHFCLCLYALALQFELYSTHLVLCQRLLTNKFIMTKRLAYLLSAS